MSYPDSDYQTTLDTTFSKLFARLAPPPRLTVSQWADRHRRLSPEASAEPGRWDTSRAEYQRGMMDACNDATIESVVLMTSSQIGKTEILGNILGFYMHQDPAPVLFLQPTLEMAQAYSKDRLSPMMRDTPALRNLTQSDRVNQEGGHKKSTTLLHKAFPGGHVTLAGSNSPASLASRPIRILLVDEVSRAPESAGKEGDPVSLARKRTTTYWNRKIILTSTPTIEGECRIASAFEESDKRFFFIPCPHCGHYQRLIWTQVTWPKDEPEKAMYGCEDCGALWNDRDRWAAVRLGEWRATEKFTGTAGFHLSEMYSPWVRLASTALAFMEARRGGNEMLKVWVNTSMGETWKADRDQEVDWANIHRRREHYSLEEIPEDVLQVTVGIDCQDDRFELEFIGWGEGEESWGLGYVRLYGDPARPMIWQKLRETVVRQFTRADGVILDVALCVIDSGGHYTDEVYQWCLNTGRQWAIPVKGHHAPGKPVAAFPRKPGKDHKVYLTMVGADTAKEILYSRYQVTEPGPGYSHFPVSEDYDEEYFQQLVAESRVRRIHKGRETYQWIKQRARNEACDVRVYSLAAIRILQQHRGIKLRKEVRKAHNAAEQEQTTADVEKRDSGRERFIRYEGSWL